MRSNEFITEADTYQPPELAVGDKILKGKFKNSPAEIKGFKKDKHNQPVLQTNKGDVQLFKPRVTKLMKEEELDEYENGTDNSREINAKLASLGYHRIGTGQDATVWSKDESSVIKILMPSDKPDRAESGFITFYEFCQSHKDLPTLPKFIDIGGTHHSQFVINGKPYRQIAMEKLQPLTSGGLEEPLIWQLGAHADKKLQWEILVKKMSSTTWPDGSGMIAVVQRLADDRQFNVIAGLLYATMQALYAIGRNKGLGWDLHPDNVMQRSDGTLVIIDPYYS